ncbi:MAG: GNAT family N-acetyltransferase [Balneolaceae bacterium]|nr:MAG: GNAT family N-acetyltransferase [Balneolaceae bacterium]
MESYVLYEIIGYAASVLVAISLMMSAIVKLRVVNMIGAFTFAIYGILINSIPVAAMNAFIVLINVYFLVKIFKSDKYFELLPSSYESTYLKKFLSFYKESIQNYQPDFSFKKSYNWALFVLSDMVPAGLILGNRKDNRLQIDLDFVIPSYRDFKIGKYLFNEKLGYFKSEGIETIVASPGNEYHNNYLEKVGFERENDLYILSIK